MDIKVKFVKIQRREEEEDVGYTAHFINTSNEREIIPSLPVIFGSHVDTFLKLACCDNYVELVMVDNRIIALSDRIDRIELVRDVVLDGFMGREADGNIKYIEETYGVGVDILEAMIKEAIKDHLLKITPVKVTEKSVVAEWGIWLKLDNGIYGTEIPCPTGTSRGNFVLKIAGDETDMSKALEKIIGREMYVVLWSLNVLAMVDKETQEICVFYADYSLDGELEKSSAVKELEERRGVDAKTLDIRIKRLIENRIGSN